MAGVGAGDDLMARVARVEQSRGVAVVADDADALLSVLLVVGRRLAAVAAGCSKQSSSPPTAAPPPPSGPRTECTCIAPAC